MNSKAIADAIAGKFSGLTSTSGETLVSEPTASLPNTVAKGPVILVYHPSGELSLGVSSRRQDILDFPVKLLRDPLDVPGRSDALYAWYDGMRDAIEVEMDLGLSAYVAWAQVVGVRIELDGESYAASEGGRKTFDVIELTVRVRLDEVVSTVGI